MSSIMPMSALLSALCGAGRQHLTASRVAGKQAGTGSHVLRLHGYKQEIRKKIPNGESLKSAAFSVGGHRWRIMCYPNGTWWHKGYTSLFLESLGPCIIEAPRARLVASVLDRAGKPSRAQTAEQWSVQLRAPRVWGEGWGWNKFVKNDDLELLDDCLTVLCDVTVAGPPLRVEVVTADPPEPEPTVATPPPFELRGLAQLIWSKQPADVTVHAGGETFPAHRWVLEARSPLFKAELQNTTSGELHIADMDAEVFKALLYFIYTDTALPATHQVEVRTMAERLLAAADRYGMEKLKLACGETLCERVDRGSVAATLELAERHGCAVHEVPLLSQQSEIVHGDGCV